MKTALLAITALLMLAGVGFAAEHSWTGIITDTMCATSHQSNIEHAEKNSGKKMSDQECTVGCVMHRGQKYVLVVGGKTYQIENQDHAGLAEHAARLATVTGSLTGSTIIVSKIATPTSGSAR